MARSRRISLFHLAAMVIGAIALAVAAKAWSDTMAAPVVRRVALPFALPDGPRVPTRIAVISDIHVAGPEMTPDRVEGIVRQIASLEPDLVLIAGDLVTDRRLVTRRYSTAEAVAPLRMLPRDVVKLAVPGNHDHWRDVEETERELAAINVGVLRNEVANVGGVLVAGLDDDYTRHARLGPVVAQVRAMNRPAIVLSHSPDPFPDLPADFGIMLAGHTHCGQIAWPWGGSPAHMSRFGQRYACGVVRENGNVLVTGAGLGVSVLPFRLFTRPEIWLIELRAK